MRRDLSIVALCGALLFGACGIEKPGMPDGEGRIVLTVVDTSGTIQGSTPGKPFPVGRANVHASVQIRSLTHEFTAETLSDTAGVASFDGLASGRYSVFGRFEYVSVDKRVFSGFLDLVLNGETTFRDTLLVNLASVSSGLVINEIYYCGAPCYLFFFDQYVELHNAFQDTLYLDGVILTRQLQTRLPDIDTRPDVVATYAYQFPGTPFGKQYPIAPGQFIVIAADALNHKTACKEAVDLSHADWECFNALASDYDNPNVPNLTNINPSSHVDYLINLVHNAIVIANGSKYGFDDAGHVLIPLATVLDGVEYSTNPSMQKELTARVDAGFAGVGVIKYSGMSVERRELGLDTDNSSYDFENLPRPTPGFSHAQSTQKRYFR